MDPAAMAALAITIGAVYVTLEKFRKTSHGDNPWSVDGVLGAFTIMSHVETVAKLTGAQWNSVFRSPAIQRAIYDAKRKVPAQWDVVEASAKKAGLTTEAYVAKLSTGTRHARGLAGDFSKPGLPTSQLAPQIFELAKSGRIGRVKKVLDERDHVHVEWFAPWESAKPPLLESV